MAARLVFLKGRAAFQGQGVDLVDADREVVRAGRRGPGRSGMASRATTTATSPALVRATRSQVPLPSGRSVPNTAIVDGVTAAVKRSSSHVTGTRCSSPDRRRRRTRWSGRVRGSLKSPLSVSGRSRPTPRP